jgi:hypothetical protein
MNDKTKAQRTLFGDHSAAIRKEAVAYVGRAPKDWRRAFGRSSNRVFFDASSRRVTVIVHLIRVQ